MKKNLIPNVAGGLLGLLFAMASIPVLFHLVQIPPPPEGTPVAMFMGAFAPTGYMTFVKVLELTGAVLVAIPKTRNLGLLILGPIIVNIIAFHVFLGSPKGLLDPMVVAIIGLSLFLLWAGRKAFAGLLATRS